MEHRRYFSHEERRRRVRELTRQAASYYRRSHRQEGIQENEDKNRAGLSMTWAGGAGHGR